jgi:hypothetical protein
MTAGSLRAALISLLSIAAVAASTAPALAGASVTATVSNPLSGTYDHPREVEVGIDATVAAGFPADAGARATSIALTLSDLVVDDASGEPDCPASQLLADEALCPAGAQVGSGTIDLDLPSGAEHVAVGIYRSAGSELHVLYTGTGLRVAGLGALDGVSGVRLDLPDEVAAPLGVPAQVRRIQLTLGTHRPGLPGWLATTNCTPIGWTMDVDVAASDGTSAGIASDRVRCQPGSYVEPSLSVSDTEAGTPAAPKLVTATATLAALPEWPAPWADGQLSGYALAFGPGIALGAGPGDPSCPAAQVAIDDTACPTGSRVATGSLKLGHTAGAPLALRVYNAPGGTTVNVLALTPWPSVVTGTLDAAGRTLSVPIPAGLAEPDPGHYMGMTSLALTFEGSGGAGWLRTVGCPGAWTLQESLQNAGVGVETGPPASVACTPGPDVVVPPPAVRTDLAPQPAGAAAVPAPVAATGDPVVPPVVVPKAPRKLPKLHVAFSTRTVHGGLGRLLGIANVAGLPSGTKVAVRCVRGCSLRRSYVTRRSDAHGHPRLTFAALRLTAATRVEVTATLAGYQPQALVFRFVAKRGVVRAVAVSP